VGKQSEPFAGNDFQGTVDARHSLRPMTEGSWLLLLAGLWAGAQNALAGGGSFVTLPALMLAGFDARVANLSSSVALFPGQITTAWANRKLVTGTGDVAFRLMLLLSIAGGVVGAFLLLRTPSDVFRGLLPWLTLTATLLFARGAFGRSLERRGLSKARTMWGQFAIAIYGGYFGGGIGFLMLALYTLAGTSVRAASANKNALMAAMNGAGAIVFAFSGEVAWSAALLVGMGSMAGGYAGAHAVRHVPEKALRIFVVAIGLALTAGLFVRG
jgi:uncharacterized membrane protein YfcA